MIASRFASAVVIVSFLTALPAVASADETAARPVPSVDFRAAVDRAVTQPGVHRFEPPVGVSKSSPVLNARQSAAGGGGGGKGALIWGLVGTAASLATTYFVIKEVKKQTDLVTKQQ